MYRIFYDQMSNRAFVEDLDIVRTKLAIINDRMGLKGCLSANYYYNSLGLAPQYPDKVFTVFDGTIFEMYPSKYSGVDVVSIDIVKIIEPCAQRNEME